MRPLVSSQALRGNMLDWKSTERERERENTELMADSDGVLERLLVFGGIMSRVNCFGMDTGNGAGVPDDWRNAATYSGRRSHIRIA